MTDKDVDSSEEYERFRCFKCGRVLFFAKLCFNVPQDDRTKISIKCLRRDCGIFNKFTL